MLFEAKRISSNRIIQIALLSRSPPARTQLVSRTLFSRTTFRSSCCNRVSVRGSIFVSGDQHVVYFVYIGCFAPLLWYVCYTPRCMMQYEHEQQRRRELSRTRAITAYMLVVLSAQPVVSKSQLGVVVVAVAATAAAKLTAAAATAVVNALRRSLLIYSLLVLLVQ